MNIKNYYKLKITTLSPLYIGTGEVYEPTNFVIDNGYLYEFDEVLFLQSLNTLEKKSFEQKLNDYIQIIGFYKSHKNRAKQIAYHKIEVSKKVQDVYNKIKNLDGTQNKNQLEIQKTYKDPNTHKAVIPGSSIKGMLDTVFQIYQQKVKENDIRQRLRLSDMLLLNGETKIQYCYRRHKNPNKKAKSPIPQIVENIDKEAVFIGSMKTNLDFIDIKNKFIEYFNANSRKNNYFKTTNDSFVARIGKFSGKAFMVDEGNNVLNSKFKPVATHTLDENDNPFGWIKIELISDDEFSQNLEKIESQNRDYFQELQDRQKEIKGSIKKEKEEALKLKKEKEQKAFEEQRRKEEEEKRKQEELSKMSPLDRKILELKKTNPNPNETIDIIIFNAIKKGELDEFKCEALKRLKEEMINLKKWIESSKKPQKDKKYKRTQEIIKMLNEC